MKKRILTAALAVICMLAFCGCDLFGGGNNNNQPPPAKTYTVRLTLENNGTYKDITVTENEKIPEFVAPVKEGFAVEGWYTNRECTATSRWNLDTDLVTSDIELYVKWTVAEHKITFDSNGGSAVAPTFILHNGIITPPVMPTKSPMIFVGWFKDSAFATAWIFKSDKVTANTTLYAKWAEPCTITFDSMDGSAVAPMTVAKGHPFAPPDDPILQQFGFENWYTDENLTTAWNFETGTTSADITLYAKYVNATSNLEYALINNDTEYAVSAGTAGSEKIIVIPHEYNNKPVTTVKNFFRKSFTKIIMPEGITTIERDAFNDCDNLEYLRFPASAVNIDIRCWNSTNKLRKFLVSEDNPNFAATDGVLYNKDFTTLVAYPRGKMATAFIVPNSVTKIGDSAFSSSAITGVTFGDKVTEIGKNSFYQCRDLNTIELPSSLTSIGASAFYWNSLVSITVPKSVTSIGDIAFANGNKLKTITVEDGNTAFCSENGVLFNKNKTVLHLFPSKNAERFYSIPATVTEIKPSAFEYVELFEFEIPAGLNKIGRQAFSGFEAPSIVFPEGITELDEQTFYQAKVDEITFKGKLTKVGFGAFQGLEGAKYGSNSTIINFTQNVIADSASGKGWSDNWNADAKLTINWQI